MKKLLPYITTLLLIIVLGAMVYGREGKKLYSIGNNVAWNNAGTWSEQAGGASAGLIPQGNDTLVVNTRVILNSDFNFHSAGLLEMQSSGLLRGSSFSLSFNAASSLVCSGEIQVGSLNFLDNSLCSLGYNGKLLVQSSLTFQSNTPAVVIGEVEVAGTLTCNSPVTSGISGTGYVSSGYFSGAGKVMGMIADEIPSGSVLSEVNWTGALNSDWQNATNWSGGVVPSVSNNVAILPVLNQPVINENGFTHHLILSPDTRLVVNTTGTLRVEGKLEVDPESELFLANTGTQHSSLITLGTVTGSVKSEIQIPANQPILVSSPLANAVTGVFVNMYLRDYNEASSSWGEYIIPTNIGLESMKGYELMSPYSSSRVFEGNPVQGEVLQSISADNQGWNLIGNPYPCYLDWKQDDPSNTGWQRNNISKAIYYPDPNASGNYSVYLPGTEDVSLNNGSRYIAPMQGFFVRASQTGVVKVNKNAVAVVTENSTSGPGSTSLKFRIEGNGMSDESLIRFNSASTFDFDDDFDAYKIPGSGNAPNLYTSLGDGTALAVNTMPSLSSSLDIPISVTSNVEGTFKLMVSGNSNFEFRYPITLEDKLNNTYTDLRKDSVYMFDHSLLNDPSRFVLHFDLVAGNDDINSNTPNITYSLDNIRITGMENQNCIVEVCNLEGKQLLQYAGLAQQVLNIPFSGYHGVIIVKVTTKTTSHAEKLVAE